MASFTGVKETHFVTAATVQNSPASQVVNDYNRNIEQLGRSKDLPVARVGGVARHVPLVLVSGGEAVAFVVVSGVGKTLPIVGNVVNHFLAEAPRFTWAIDEEAGAQVVGQTVKKTTSRGSGADNVECRHIQHQPTARKTNSGHD